MAKSRPSGAKRRSEGNGKLLREDASNFVLSDEVRNSVLNGTSTTVPIEAAKQMLQQGFSVTAKNGENYSFDADIVNKYEHGIMQNGNARRKGKNVARIRQIGEAVRALKDPNYGVFELPADNPPQVVFIHTERKRDSMIVFVDRNSKKVRSFYSVGNIKNFMSKISGRIID